MSINNYKQGNKVQYKSVLDDIRKKFIVDIDKHDGKTEEKNMLENIQNYIEVNSISVENLTSEELLKKLYDDLVEFSFLTKYLKDEDIEEVNINAWEDIKITGKNNKRINCKEKFQSPEDALNIVKRLLQRSNKTVDKSSPSLVTYLKNNLRITVVIPPLVSEASGVFASIIRTNPSDYTDEFFIEKGTATEPILKLISIFSKYGISQCYAGATSSGKTSLLSWSCKQIPNEKRIISIEEDTKDLDFRKIVDGVIVNDSVHFTTSSITKVKTDIEKLVLLSLTANPDTIVLGEMKSYEAYETIKAGTTGHTIVTSIHANSAEDVYTRVADLTKNRFTERQVKKVLPIVVYLKTMSDGSRKITEVLEATDEGLNTLLKYDDGFIFVNSVSQNLIKQMDGITEEELTFLTSLGGTNEE